MEIVLVDFSIANRLIDRSYLLTGKQLPTTAEQLLLMELKRGVQFHYHYNQH